jgi:hypothetical protein
MFDVVHGSPETGRDNHTKASIREGQTATCCLTEYDAGLLERAVDINGGINTPIGRAVADKLSHAELRSSIPPDYVELNSHVIFRVNGRSPLSRILVHWDKFLVSGLHLSLHTPWGMTLLGMKAGDEATVYYRGGIAETIRIVSVAHQPGAKAPDPHKPYEKARRSERGGSPYPQNDLRAEDVYRAIP